MKESPTLTIRFLKMLMLLLEVLYLSLIYSPSKAACRIPKLVLKACTISFNPLQTNINLFKLNNRNTRKRCKISLLRISLSHEEKNESHSIYNTMIKSHSITVG